MRREKQQLSRALCVSILECATSGVLALASDEYPYAVPLSFVYHEDTLYFHIAKSGQKLDMLRKNDKGSFCIIDQDEIHPEALTTYFRSVIVFGSISIIQDLRKKRWAIDLLAKKYSPSNEEGRQKEINQQIQNMEMLEFTIEKMSGKAAIELIDK